MVRNTLRSWKTGTQTGNRHRLVPARMVGWELCSEMRQSSMDAGSVFFRIARRSHGRLLLAPFILFIVGLRSPDAKAEIADRKMLPPAKTQKMAAKPLQSKQESVSTPEEVSAARGLEQMMVNMMIEEMRKSVPENELVPVSQGERVFRQMLDQEHARMMSEAGVLGIADLVLDQMHGKR